MAIVNGAVISQDGSLTSLQVNEELTVEGVGYSSLHEAKGSGVAAIAAGTITETTRTSYTSLTLYGVEGSVVSGTFVAGDSRTAPGQAQPNDQGSDDIP